MEGSRRLARRLVWPLSANLAAALVWVLQIDGRGPLAWDEAERVNSGADLALAIDRLQPGTAWDWAHDQTFWPFLASGFNGVAYWLTGGDTVVSAWLPTLLAYAIAGVLVAWLARALGAGEVGAWVAAALFWLAPIEAKLAAGCFTEPAGACVEVGLLLILIRLRHDDRRHIVLAAAGLVALACWLKYDYGLVAAATVVLTGLAALAEERRLAALAPHALALAAAAVPVAGLFAFNAGDKWRGLGDVVGPAVPDEIAVRSGQAGDFSFYLRSLVAGDDSAFFLPVALFLLAGAGWGVSRWRSRPAVLPALAFLVVWLVVYSVAGAKQDRLIGTLIPVLAAFAGALVSAAWARLPRAALRLAAVALLASLAVQALRLDERFGYLEPNPPAEAALAFSARNVEASGRTVIMLGISREFPPAALALARRDGFGGRPAPVLWVREARPEERAAVLAEHLRHFQPRAVVGVEILPGSRLYTDDYRWHHPGQRDYVRLARALEAGGTLRRLAGTTLERGRLRVTVWRVAEPRRRFRGNARRVPSHEIDARPNSLNVPEFVAQRRIRDAVLSEP